MLASPPKIQTSLLSKNSVKEGDLCIVYEGPQSMKQIIISKGKIFNNKFGAFFHDDLIGKEYGSKVQLAVFSKNRKGFVYLLKPSGDLYTATLSHRTQILYSADISLVIYQLRISPGKTVLESGTGSGSLSFSIANALVPNGMLYTYEFNEMRAQKAQEDFKNIGLDTSITVTHRDVCENGFGIEGKVIVCDAVFLDLPKPWTAIPHAAKLMRLDAMLCSFSPCIEQVQKACQCMKEEGFAEIRTFECISRFYDVHDLEYEQISPEISQAPKNSIEEEGRKNGNKEPNLEDEKKGEDPDLVKNADNDGVINSSKDAEKELVPSQKSKKPKQQNKKKKEVAKEAKTSVAYGRNNMRGHTGYLTFGRKI